jgi:NADP-dependent 3-hydroxy acid dehydrogenase YdfG
MINSIKIPPLRERKDDIPLIAVRFLEEGARVAILDRDSKGLQEIRKALPGIEKTLLADVALPQEVSTPTGIFKEIEKTLASIIDPVFNIRERKLSFFIFL